MPGASIRIPSAARARRTERHLAVRDADLARSLRASADRWFQRTDVPIWITEYAYQTSPDAKRGVSARVQAEYAARALELAAKVLRVQLFVWFTFRDDYTNAWRAGLLDAGGRERPSTSGSPPSCTPSTADRFGSSA